MKNSFWPVGNILAAVLLMSQCGCGHTYFAWKKPLPVDQTEVHPLPPPGFLGVGDFTPQSYWPIDRSGDRKEMQRSMERSVRTSFPKR